MVTGRCGRSARDARPRLRRYASVVFALAACWSGGARAEVRLERQGAGRLVPEVTLGTLGPWSPIDEVDVFTLNPRGDLRGDGVPSFAQGPTGVRAAWLNGRQGELLVAHGDEQGWESTRRLPADSPFGTPTLLVRAEASLGLWQSLDSDGRVLLHASYFDELPDADQDVSTILGEGQLLTAWSGAREFFVLVAEPDGQQGLQAVVFALPSKPIIPIGIGRIELDRQAPVEATATGPIAGFGRVAKEDGAQAGFAYWWLGDGGLRFVQLDADGEPLLPVEVLPRKSQAHGLQPLVNEARRIVKKRLR